MEYKADLHIHSCLSPCGSLYMSPKDIVKKAVEIGLDLIAISDHNSAKNLPALKKVCESTDSLSCLFGIEATSVEETHNLCLFDTLETALDFEEYLTSHIKGILNVPEKMGDQVFVNEHNEIIGEISLFLGNASDLALEQLLDAVHERDGLFIPAHIDRHSFSLYSQLGFVPENNYDALEISSYSVRTNQIENVKKSIINSTQYPLITNSDAHYLSDIGRSYTTFNMDTPSLHDLKNAIASGCLNLS